MSEVQNHPGSKHADSRLLDVVALVKRGDAMAFEELYRLTYKYAYFHAKSILHDDDEAWDLVQETYIAVYQHIDSLREERYVKSWISGIVFNLGMKRLRKKRDLLVDGENDFLFDALEDENTDVSPEKALDSKETAAIVREVIDRLPALQKAAVIAYYFDEKSVADIAREAMCSENTIKSRLNYARKAMKEGIEHKERQMGVKLHVVTGPMIVFVLRGMFSSMTVSAQKARYTWMAVRKTLGLAGMAAGAGSAGSAGGGAGGSAGNAGGAAGSTGNAGSGAAGSAGGTGGAAGSAGSAGGSAAGSAGGTGCLLYTSPAVLAHPVREHPDISHTHGRSHASQDKAQARLETAVLVAFMFLGSVALKTIPHYISPLRIFYLYRLADNRGLVKPIISLFPTASPRSPPPPWTTGSPPAPGPRWRRDSRSRTGCGRRSC